MLSPGTRLDGRYELLAPLGHDDLTARWRARDLRSARHVEVRIVDPRIAGDAALRGPLLERTQRAKGVAHPNLARTLGGGVDGDVVYVVGQLVDGPTLGEAIDRRGRLAPDDAVEIAVPLARAVAATHGRGLAHGRVTAEEVRLGPDGRPRLGGLAIGGLAPRAPHPDGAIGTGTAALTDRPPTPEDDIRALGLVLSRMLSGTAPGDPAGPTSSTGDGEDALTVPRPRAALPPSLSAIVERATAADPARRYRSTEALASALVRWRKAHPVAARPPGPVRGSVRTAFALREAVGSSVGTGARADMASPARATSPAGANIPVASATARPNAASLVPSVSPPGVARAMSEERDARAASGPLTRRSLAREREERRRERSGDLPAPAGSRRQTPLILGAWVLVVLAAAAFLGIVVAGQLLAGGGGPRASLPAVGAMVPPSLGPTAPATAPPAAQAPGGTAGSDAAPSSPVGSLAPSAAPATAEAAASSPAPIRAPASLSAPARSVWAFYDAVASHDWPTAISLWSARMQTDYPPQRYLIDRFTPTTGIKITDIRTRAVDSGAGTARVSVALIEYRSVAPSPRTFTGYWDLVRVDGRWLLDHPTF